MLEENEDSQNCNYITLRLHDIILTFKKKKKREKRSCQKEGIILIIMILHDLTINQIKKKIFVFLKDIK